MRQRVGPLGELDGFDSRFVQQHPALENIHRRSIKTGTQIDELSTTVWGLTLDDGSRGLAGEPSRVQQIIIGEETDRRGPLERRQRRLNRATGGIIEGEQSRSLICAQQQVRKTFGSVEEGSYRQRPRGRHESKLS